MGRLILGGFATAFGLSGIWIIYDNFRSRKLSLLKKNGMKIQGNLCRVELARSENFAREHRNMRSYRLYFAGKNPITGKEQHFSFCSTERRITDGRLESGTVNIYVNPKNHSEAYVDIPSCVLVLKA